MKRAHLQRVKSVEHSPSQAEGSVERYDRATNEGKRKKRTSAAMIGLALSMGTSGLLMPRQNDGATAAEPTPPDAATVSMVPSVSAVPTAMMIEHVVSKGQTLWQLAHQYHVSVDTIAAVNSLKTNDLVRVGQIIKIPTAASEVRATEAQRSVEFSTRAPQQVASADLNSLPVAANPTEAKAETVNIEVAQAQRNVSLDRLRQQQEKLRRSLADLRTKEQAAKTEAMSSTEAVQPESSAIASTPSQSAGAELSSAGLIANAPSSVSTVPIVSTPTRVTNQPTVSVNVQQVAANPKPETVSYQVSLGDTVARIASAHNISPSTLVQTNRISDPNFIFVGQVLRVPAAQTVASAPTPRDRQSTPVRQAHLSVVPSTATATAIVNPVPAAVQPLGSNLSTPSESADSRHIETLLSEIKVLRERHRATSPTLATTPSAPVPETIQIATSTLPTPSVSVQFNPGRLNTVQAPQPTVQAPRSQSIPVRVPTAESSVPAVERSQASSAARQTMQVAAAPAGAESYAPLLQPITGRVVSPELPPLQGEDSFLPEGAASFKGYIWPAKGLLTSGYGWRWGRMHAGIDIAADVGTPVSAAADGVVEFSEWNSGGYGNLIEIRHADGSLTRYAHLNRSLVHAGQKVKQGEQIAEMGSTGRSTGPHLHFEVHPVADGGGAVDPIAYLPK